MQTRRSHLSFAKITQGNGMEAEVSCPLIQCPPMMSSPSWLAQWPHTLQVPCVQEAGATALLSAKRPLLTPILVWSRFLETLRDGRREGAREWRPGDSYWSLSCGWDLNPHPKLRFSCSSKNPKSLIPGLRTCACPADLQSTGGSGFRERLQWDVSECLSFQTIFWVTFHLGS